MGAGSIMGRGWPSAGCGAVTRKRTVCAKGAKATFRGVAEVLHEHPWGSLLQQNSSAGTPAGYGMSFAAPLKMALPTGRVGLKYLAIQTGQRRVSCNVFGHSTLTCELGVCRCHGV